MLQVSRHNIITTNRKTHRFRTEASLSLLCLLTVKGSIHIRTRHRGILVLDRGEWSASRPDRFNCGRIFAGTHWMMFLLALEPIFSFWREEKSLVLSGNQRPDPPACVLFFSFSEFVPLGLVCCCSLYTRTSTVTASPYDRISTVSTKVFVWLSPAIGDRCVEFVLQSHIVVGINFLVLMAKLSSLFKFQHSLNYFCFRQR